jgi:predicted nucleic acid-binding protein
VTLVIDASVAVGALTVRDDVGAWCEQQIESGPIWAPHLLPVEVTNSLRRRVAAGQLTRAVAAAALSDLSDLPFAFVPFEPFEARVWELCQSLTAYDAWYVALAEAMDCPMATLDLRLTRAPGPTCAFVTPG